MHHSPSHHCLHWVSCSQVVKWLGQSFLRPVALFSSDLISSMKTPFSCFWCVKFSPAPRAGLRGEAIAPGPPLQGAPSDEIYLFQIKYSFEKISWFRSDTRIKLYIIFLCCVKYQGPQQQLISLQVWLFASFSNRYWIAYKYFRFCWMQIYLISLVTFS